MGPAEVWAGGSGRAGGEGGGGGGGGRVGWVVGKVAGVLGWSLASMPSTVRSRIGASCRITDVILHASTPPKLVPFIVKL